MRAFSLIEVMVVVAILGIAAALAVPKMLPEIHKAQLDGDAEAAANLVARARAEAMYSKRCVRVHLGATSVTNVTATTGTQISVERLNSFDCDQITPTQKIDSTQPIWIQIDTLNAANSNIQFSIPTVPSDLTAGSSTEIRFRPNGRVWSNEALTAPLSLPTALQNDDAIVLVTHTLSSSLNEFASTNGSQRRVLVQGNGLVCVLPRGFTPAGPPFFCP